MGLCFLLTFYCFVRAQDSSRAGWWYAGAVAACLLAAGSKEVAVAIPPLLVWYDRAFLASSWRELLRKRWPFYTALAGVLVLLGLLVLRSLPVYRGGRMLVVEGISPLDYARTQPEVILHYLRLSVWPLGQCLDYGWEKADTFVEIVPPLLILLVLMGLTVWCIWRHPAWGFLGGWFFLVLAPSSSFIPIHDLAFEHRMYLPLAAVLLALLIAAYELLLRLPTYRTSTLSEQRLLRIVPLVVVVVALGSVTFVRNHVYSSGIAMWEDIKTKRPNHARAYNNLGLEYQQSGQRQLALENYYAAIKLDPDYYDPHYNIGLLLKKTDPDQAIKHFQICLKATSWIAPRSHCHLAMLAQEKGRLEEARRHAELVVSQYPDNLTYRNVLASVLIAQDDLAGALKICEGTLRIQPNNPEALDGKATVFDRLGRRAEAVQYCRQALEAYPNSAGLHYKLAKMLPPDDPEALQHLQLAIYYHPRFAEAYVALGDLLAHAGNLPEAISQYQQALQIRPGYDEARKKLNALLRAVPHR
jgi:tetratricopeptide (TPR) repeat protein